MKHRHHIIPKHAGGSNDPSNIEMLTVEEHTEAHRKLYEKYGNEYDKLAYQGLAGIIGKEEIVSKVIKESHKRRWSDPVFKEKYSKRAIEWNKELWSNTEYKEMMRKVQSRNATGENNPKAKLIKEDIIDIVIRNIKGESIKNISKIYNVSNQLIYRIKAGKTWRSVKCVR
jgi:hypothetical protein